MSRKPAPRRKRANHTGSIRVIGTIHELRYPEHLGGGTRRIPGCTYAHAEAELNKWIASRDVRYVEMGPVPTVAEWAQKYLDTYSRNKHRPTTRRNYELWVRTNICNNPIGRIKITALTEGDVEDWYAGFVDPERKPRPLRASSLRSYRDRLEGIVQFAVERRKDMPVNPVRTAIKPTVENLPEPRTMLFLERHEIERFMEQCQTGEWGALWITSALLGLRPGEACALHWADVHFDATVPYVYVQHSLVRPHDDAIAVGPTKHKNHARKVELSEPVIVALHEHRRRRGGIVPAEKQWSDLVFLRDDGTPLPMRYARQQLHETCRQAMTALLTPYQLRHTCATWLIDAGVSPKHIAWMMGTSVAMLDRHYGHKMDGDVHTVGTKVMNGIGVGGKVVPIRKRRAG